MKIVKEIFVVNFLLFAVFPAKGFARPVSAFEKIVGKQNSSMEIISKETDVNPLVVCRDQELGIKISCSPDWQVQEDADGILLIISEDPAILLSIVKIKGVNLLGQLNRDYLKALGGYADGFETEDVEIAHSRTIRVKAFSEQFPDIRLTDYYVIHRSQLYGLLFSVDPKEEWDHYKFMIQEMVKSFDFLDSVVKYDDNKAVSDSHTALP